MLMRAILVVIYTANQAIRGNCFTDIANQRKNMERLIDALEDNEDVQNVWHNWDQD